MAMDQQRFGPFMGSILVASWFATALSGVMLLQAYIYFRNRPRNDHRIINVLVSVLLLLDMGHVACIMATLYHYLIRNFGSPDVLVFLTPPLALTVGLTGTITFFAQSFFTWRIWKISKGNLIAPVIFVLQTARMVCGWVTTVKAIKAGTFAAFSHQIRWIFTAGVAIAVVCDVLITSSLCYYLHTSRSSSKGSVNRMSIETRDESDHVNRMNDIIDEIILYTVENGSLTAVSSIASLICVIAMPGNLIFIAIHFIISKLYINSVLASLNTRNAFRAHKEHATRKAFRTRFFSTGPQDGSASITNENLNAFPLQSPRLPPQGHPNMDNFPQSKIDAGLPSTYDFITIKADHSSLDERYSSKSDMVS